MALLRHSIGLNPDTIGPEVMARAVRHRMVQCAASNLTYAFRHASPADVGRLFEAERVGGYHAYVTP